MSQPLKVATRGSDLALFQTRFIISVLKAHGYDAEELIMKTRGDVDYRPLLQMRGDGFFTKELEHALLSGAADFAVHSSKDLPSTTHYEIPWMATGERASDHDVIIAKKGFLKRAGDGLTLPTGARVGTSSPRRMAQLEHAFAGVQSVQLRGNVPTRARKPLSGELDAVILAKAGLDRLNLWNDLAREGAEWQELPWVTAPCQGILGVQASRKRSLILNQIANPSLHEIAMAEKSILALLGGGCHLPVGCRVEKTLSGYGLHLFYQSQGSQTHAFTVTGSRVGDVLRTAFQRLMPRSGGRRVWVTTPLQHTMKPAHQLAEAGFAPVVWPLIEIAPNWAARNFVQTLANWNSTSTLAFGSRFGAQIFLREFIGVVTGEDALKNKTIYCVGAATREPFDEMGIAVATLPDEATAASLADQIEKTHRPAAGLLIPGAADSRLAHELRNRHLNPAVLELYKTLPSTHPLTRDVPIVEDGDIAVFTSPSAVRVFKDQLIKYPSLKSLQCAAIGPSTWHALKEIGQDAILNTVSGSWGAMIDHLKRL